MNEQAYGIAVLFQLIALLLQITSSRKRTGWSKFWLGVVIGIFITILIFRICTETI